MGTTSVRWIKLRDTVLTDAVGIDLRAFPPPESSASRPSCRFVEQDAKRLDKGRFSRISFAIESDIEMMPFEAAGSLIQCTSELYASLFELFSECDNCRNTRFH
ncbi:hypothetical protein AD953_03805 [Acetobacter malorum]|uniref:Uncharacterized protein n=1 Tax=Acetobacter malorum TaxID=178901 RepID=A0A149VFA9_9PROT|nr:hypothetical protein AD953_03805 [Acetobacter malorum]